MIFIYFCAMYDRWKFQIMQWCEDKFKYTQIKYVVLSIVHWYRDRLKLQLDYLDFF